jgi:hypothetical protein
MNMPRLVATMVIRWCLDTVSPSAVGSVVAAMHRVEGPVLPGADEREHDDGADGAQDGVDGEGRGDPLGGR